MTFYLSEHDVIALGRELLGEQFTIRDRGAIDAAVARPQTTVDGEDAFPDVWTKAAALLQSIVQRHPLVDGNKRLGWVCARTFLAMNGTTRDGHITHTAADVLEDLILSVAAGRVDDVDELAERIRSSFML